MFRQLPILLALLPVPASAGLAVSPAEATLRGRDDRQRLIVTETAGQRTTDLTRDAKFASDRPTVAVVSADGIVTPVGDGTAAITATANGQSAKATVRVVDGATFRPTTFERDIEPILARMGCNA